MALAPIALFTFKRPEHTARALASLRSNPEFLSSPLFVYCDGPRSEADVPGVLATRQVVRDAVGRSATMVERERNVGLAASVIAGVTELCDRFGRVVVLEDDLVLAPTFLRFMNDALERYREDARIYQVSGHMFPVRVRAATDALLMPFITTWGWATWSRAWKHLGAAEPMYERLRASRSLRRRFDLQGAYPYFRMLERQVRGEIDSWGIRWYVSVFEQGGLTVYPRVSLVGNTGFDGSGTHCDDPGQVAVSGPADELLTRFPPAEVDGASFAEVRAYLAANHSLSARVRNRVHRLASRLLHGRA